MYGQAFADFLLEGKMAVLNGRCCPLSDSYTCISHKGRSAFDYIATAHENLQNVISLNVLPITDIVDAIGIQDMCEGRISDHSILKCVIAMRDVSENESSMLSSFNVSRISEEAHPPKC